MKLKKKRYNKMIKIYYRDKFSKSTIKYVVNQFFEKENQKNLILVKKNNGRKVYRIEVDKKIYYIKIFKYRKLKKALKSFFGRGEAVKSLKKLYKLLEKNIRVVEPVAAITWHNGLFIDSILITEKHEGMTVKEYVLNRVNDHHQREKIIKNIARLWANLFNNNFIHTDYNLTNFLIDENNYNLITVDVDDIYITPVLLKKTVIKYMARFNARVLSDLVNNNLPLLSIDNKLLFYRDFQKKFKRDINLKKFIIKIYRATIKRLIEKNETNLIRKDDWLSKLYNRSYGI